MVLRRVLLASFVCCFAVTASGQVPEFAAPSKEHAFLKNFAGTWATRSEATVVPGQPAIKIDGTMKGKMIGEFWVQVEYENIVQGQKSIAVQTLGFDTEKKKFIGTWVDSMMGHMWQYEGTLDEAGKVLTLETTGPNFMTGQGEADFRDVYDFSENDQITSTSFAKSGEQDWVQYVSGKSERKKE